MSTERDPAIQIRPVRTMDEMRPVVELQKTYWGATAEAIIPAHMLFSLANFGGHVLVAYDDEKAIGVLVGFLGTTMEDSRRPAMANLQILSKRMVVLPEYRGSGIAYRLKLAQREISITQGIRLIVWTFDPLLSQNAHLNLRKLGAIGASFRADYYGTRGDTGLARSGSSDRLLVEWWVTNRRVEERLFGTRAALTLENYLAADTVIINPAMVNEAGLLLPNDNGAMPATSLGLLEIPMNHPALERDHADLAQAWRMHIRTWFERLYARGYMVTDFLRAHHDGRDRAFYLLTYNGPQVDAAALN